MIAVIRELIAFKVDNRSARIARIDSEISRIREFMLSVLLSAPSWSIVWLWFVDSLIAQTVLDKRRLFSKPFLEMAFVISVRCAARFFAAQRRFQPVV